MIPLWQLAQFFGLTEAEAAIITYRGDFPEPTLMLPKYTYWNRDEVIAWVTRLRLNPANIRGLIQCNGPEIQPEAEAA
jgi:hypothetical protein